MLNAPNFQWRTTDPYKDLDRGTGAWGVRDVVLTIPEVVVATEDFETDPITGSGTWTISATTPHSGLRCLRSAIIAANQNTDYTFTIPVPATSIRFWWRVSSELNFDFFRVYKDAIIPGNLLMQASGTSPDTYAQSTLDVTGATTVTFRYIKDGSSSAGLDRAIIDDIEWTTPEVPGTYFYEPLHLEADSRRLKVTAIQEDPIVVTGVVDVRPLSCETDSITVCFEDPVSISGVVATRDLTCETDSITACQGTDPWIVLGTVVSYSGLAVEEDTPHVSGTFGDFPLAVRNDAGTPLAGNGDYIPFTTDAAGGLRVSFPRLTCGTDSVEVCNDVGTPLSVNVTNTVTFVQGKRALLGLYYAPIGPVLYTTAADAATAGDVWLVNTSPTVIAYIRQVRFTVMLSALQLLTTLPTIRMERMSFTGAPSGTLVTPAKRDTADAANAATVRTTSAGMVIAAGDAIDSFAPPAADVIGGLLAVNATAAVPVEQVFDPGLDGYIVLRQNQGVVFRQNTAGSATENRRYWLNIVWEEI